MSRAEIRRKQREEKQKKKKVYNFTEEQLQIYLDRYFNTQYKKKKDEIFAECMTLTLVLPMEVLMDHYWKKSYQKKIPEFTSHVLEYFSKWENGELDIEELKKDLWEYGGVKLETNNDKNDVFKK